MNSQKSPDESSSTSLETVDVKLETVESNSSNDSELAKLQLMKESLEKEIDATNVEEVEISQDSHAVKAVDLGKVDEYCDNQLVIDEHDSPVAVDKEDGFPIMKRKLVSLSTESKEVIVIESKRHKSIDKVHASKSTKEDVKATISKIVVSELQPFYKSKKILSSDPKSLFKTMARFVTHHFFERNPGRVPQKSDVKEFIKNIFKDKVFIKKREDFEK